MIGEVDGLTPQEDEHQNTYKLSYYTPVELNSGALRLQLKEVFLRENIRAAVVFSIDEAKGVGLLDILPESATKKHALQYLARYFELDHKGVVFAGDSGNDLEPLTSGFPAIVVNNAMESLKSEVREIAEREGISDSVYFAKGGYKDMNGNYTAGILEGLHHFGHLT